MKNITSVLIPDGEDDHALLAARCFAQLRKVKVHILSSKRWAPVRFSRHHHLYSFRPVETDYEARLEAVAEIIERFKIDVVLPVTEEGLEFVVTKHHALSGLAAISPTPTPQSFKTARNKWLLNQFAVKHHLPVPSSILVTLDSDFYQQLPRLEYPVLLKPTSQAGGRGIQRFDDSSILQRFLESQDKEQFKNNYVVENYIPGSDIDLSVLCRNGEILAFTIQQGLVDPHCFAHPMAVQFVEQEEVLEIGRRLLSALNWSGVAHIDMRHDNTEGKIKIIEINARFWGSLLGSLVVGVNFPYLACLTALDIPFPRPQYQLGKYLHMNIAVKEILRRPFGKNNLKGFTFRETGLSFLVNDPLPDIVRKIQERM